MTFTTTVDQARASRNVIYPNAQDPNFLGYQRNLDSWRVASASGTTDLPVYLTSPIPVAVAVDIQTDSIKIFSASGTTPIPVYSDGPLSATIIDPVEVVDVVPLGKTLIKRRFFHDSDNDITSIREAAVITASGQSCIVQTLSYDANKDVDYVVESVGTW